MDPHSAGDHASVEARRWKAVTLANRGLTHKMIATEMAEEYRRHNPRLTLVQIESHVGVDITRALKEYRRRADQAIEEKLTAASLRLNEIRRRLFAVIVGAHPVLYQGEIVKDGDGRPLQDAAPVLAALAQLRALEEQQARMEGTNAREKIDIALGRRVDEEAMDVTEAILAAFAALPELEPALRQRALEAAGAHLRTIEGEVIADVEEP
jgi:hypothetical protein